MGLTYQAEMQRQAGRGVDLQVKQMGINYLRTLGVGA
jgi:hypothetical protein